MNASRVCLVGVRSQRNPLVKMPQGRVEGATSTMEPVVPMEKQRGAISLDYLSFNILSHFVFKVPRMPVSAFWWPHAEEGGGP